MTKPAASQPRWDGQRLLFEMAVEGTGRVRCAISRLALLGITGGGHLQTGELLRRFGAARPRIEAAARAKLSRRTSPPLGTLHIWEDDILDPPTDSSPCAKTASAESG
ncbi:MAG TPA: DUF1488 family protein [Acetobacteraceae bacterium]|nr:DUF1488 family protein [Acetobacteraceae bacterium]